MTRFGQLELALNSQFLSQPISFNAIGPKRGNVQPFALTATASSGLPVSYTWSQVPQCRAAALPLTGPAGFITLRADQAGNHIHAAPAVRLTSAVLQVGPFVILRQFVPATIL